MSHRCKTCGYKIRGKNHTEGTHHKNPNKAKLDRMHGAKKVQNLN